jgi:hypothetical protein
MIEPSDAKKPAKLSPIALWRRVASRVCNVLLFLGAALLAQWLSNLVGGEGTSWWVGFLILLLPVVAAQLAIEAVLVRPDRA